MTRIATKILVRLTTRIRAFAEASLRRLQPANEILDGDPGSRGDWAPWATDFSTLATPQDIYFCFRLLLGRPPTREEWPGHSLLIGSELPNVVSHYVNSREFSNRNLLTRSPSAVDLLVINDANIYIAPDDLGVSRNLLSKSYEPDVTLVFQRVLRPGMGVIDVGANIGYFTMLAASLVSSNGYVLAVEPNAENMKLLEASRRANGFEQVRTALTAAGRETGLLVLNGTFANGMTAELSGSAESALTADLVPCFRLDDIVPGTQQINLIKMDAEGAEYNVLLGCQQTIAKWKPLIVSEFCPGMLPGISGIDGRSYLAAILDLGYTIAVIEPDGCLTSCETDIDKVIGVYEERGVDHIDILAQPVG